MAISDEAKLRVYNGALTEILGLRPLSSLSENREPRRVLDSVWGGGAVVTYGLERGDWNFATRAVQMTASTSVTPQFGFQKAFALPDDFARLTTISTSAYLDNPMADGQYSIEAGFIFSNHSTIYAKIVSNDVAYGFDSNKWTEVFYEYLKGRVAFLSAKRLSQSDRTLSNAKQLMEEALDTARSKDAMEEAAKPLPHGSWVRSRQRNIIRGA